MEVLYLPNDAPILSRPSNITALLETTLNQIVTKNPPQDQWDPEKCYGGWAGPTSLAYLFLHVSAVHPSLTIGGQLAIDWAGLYLEGSRGPNGPQPIDPEMCGLLGEKTSFKAVRASITKSISHVEEFLAEIPGVLSGDYNSELTYGRAGILYMLRMIRHWVPGSGPMLESAIEHVTKKVMADRPDWICFGKRYLGPGHGDIGIITQLVLTTPSVAETVQPWLEKFLELQKPDGNWDKVENDPSGKDLVQWCHGAPGCVISLVTLRPYFPSLQERIDAAIEKARKLTWGKGVLKKAPSICHGTFGNAIAFPPGENRDHFLSLALPEKIEQARAADPTSYPSADYGVSGLNLSYLPGLAWTLLKLDEDGAPIGCYTDI